MKDNKTSKKTKNSKSNKIRKKLKLKKSIPIILFSIIAIIVMMIISFITYDKYEELTEYTIENYSLYHYVCGVKSEYVGEVSLKTTGEIVELKYKDKAISIDSTPIYFSDVDNKMILPKTMGYYIPKYPDKAYRTSGFTKIRYDKNAYSSYIEKKEEDVKLDRSFMYDGADLYVFLYETPVTINGEEIVLSPLSYVFVNYGGLVYYYNKSTDEYREFQTVKQDVIAQVGLEKVNLSTDMIMNKNSNRLLIKNLNNLPVYE